MPFSKKQMLPLLALLSAFPALSTDMYLAALPTLASQWHQPLSVVNLTLASFFFTYGLFLLVYGPLSDRFGRRPVLLIGIAIYMAGSLACAFAFGPVSMISFRVVQAAGAASASALSMAMCKDLFDGNERVRILAHIAVIMTVAPMVGPVIGGYILTYLSWPFVFVVQALLGGIALIGVIGAPETLPEASGISPVVILKNYVGFLTHRRFMAYTFMMSVVGFPFFAFIGGSSDIYINIFKLSESQYGLFFALNAFAMMLGALACERLLERFSTQHLITMGYGGLLAGGILLIYLGKDGPWHLALSMCLISFFLGISRPPNNNLVLEQVERNVGTASSLLIFANMMCGAVAMELIALDWSDKVRLLGLAAAICGAIVLSMWLATWRIAGWAEK